VVRQLLIPPFPGSNPGAPASKSLFLHNFTSLSRMPANTGHVWGAARSACRKTEDEGPDFGACLCGPISVSRFHKRIA
jgi:hypothetical protein